jgi:hypothetical protein
MLMLYLRVHLTYTHGENNYSGKFAYQVYLLNKVYYYHNTLSCWIVRCRMFGIFYTRECMFTGCLKHACTPGCCRM